MNGENKLRKDVMALVQAITDAPDHSASWMPALKALRAEPKGQDKFNDLETVVTTFSGGTGANFFGLAIDIQLQLLREAGTARGDTVSDVRLRRDLIWLYATSGRFELALTELRGLWETVAGDTNAPGRIEAQRALGELAKEFPALRY